MNITYIDGRAFYMAFAAGADILIKNRNYLNKINVFPVPDADTGTNMATTIRSIIEGSRQSRSLKETLQSMADSGLSGARGNSGIIFAQYLLGISLELDDNITITTEKFSQSARRAVKHVYDSLADPVEGTMLTVIRDWSDSLVRHSKTTSDIVHILQASYNDALSSLNSTPEKLKVLAENNVVDAGANGFIYLLEGVLDFVRKGRWQQQTKMIQNLPREELASSHTAHQTNIRYCTEATISKPEISLPEFKEKFRHYGESFIVAGTSEKIHLHIHTNDPVRFFRDVKDLGDINSIKVDDMRLQYQISHERKYPLGIVTDSACDLPEEILEEYQIQQIPFGINFGDTIFLDKKTIDPHQFYNMLKTEKIHPVSSQPSPKEVENVLDFMSGNYQRVYAVHISQKLTGIFQAASKISEKYSNIKPLDTRHLSVSEGLIVLRIAEAIKSGVSASEIDENLEDWVAKARILTDVNTLKYLVRGGRVSPFKGHLATALNLKPILSVDNEGKAAAYGKSFSRRQNMKKIIAAVADMVKDNEVWNYAIVHADAEDRAQIYCEKLTDLLKKEPAYVMPLSPVLGVHNGIGAVAVGLMLK